ncbi:MAG: yjeA [Acidobacteria bacterium]|nr:yjeA [Acidobacteriota bacterium]
MTPQRLSLFLFLLLVVIAGSACGKKGNVPQAPPPGAPANAAAPEQYHQTDAATLAIPQTKFFKGSIGSRLGLQMKLTRDGERLTGNYSYQKVGTKIDLKGTIDKDGNLTLEELDTGGKQTGLFKGNWLTDKDTGLISVVGNWAKPNSEKKTAFSLHEESIEFSGGVELAAKQIKETNKKLHYQIEADYPQAAGAVDNRFEKFNQEARNLVTRQVSEFKKQMVGDAKDVATEPIPAVEDKSSVPGSTLEIGYNIALAKDDLISIQFDLGSYSSGAAHPNSSSAVLNYDVKAGKVLKLADLFNPGAKYLATLSSYCIRDLKKQKDKLPDDAQIDSGAAAQSKNYQSWTITKKGLEITFDAYQVGSYAAGPQSVVVPYSALKEIIRSDGPLAQFVK